MHARIDHLLSLRDRLPTEAWVPEHVGQCPACAAQLRRLENTRSRLQSLPQSDAPAGSWDAIRSKLDVPAAPSWQHRVRIGVAVAFLVVVGTVVTVVVRQDGLSPQDPVPLAAESTTVPAAAESGGVDRLVAQSQHLESLL